MRSPFGVPITGHQGRMRDETPPLDTAILDLDGTLVDTVFAHVVAWRRAFLEVGVDIPGWRIHRAIGIGGDRLVTEVAGPTVEHAMGDKVRELHGTHFEHALPQVTPTEGAAAMVDALRGRGLRVVVASSGEREVTERLVSLVGDGETLHEWVSGDQVEDSKPAPDLLAAALEQTGGSQALVVGDTVWDVESALRSAFPCVGLLTGGISRAELLDAGAVVVHDSPASVTENLDDVLARARHAPR